MTFIPKKSLGQNFLIDNNILNKIVELGNINQNDTIIEVGPGNGALTNKIFEKEPKDLIVIEKDEILANILKKKFGKKINVINQDMMLTSYENYIKNNLIIFGNLPYNISTQILAKWIKNDEINKFCKKLVLMFQKEVADRIIANTNSKNYGRLSIFANWKMKVEKIIDIEPGSFYPPPKVKSTVIQLTPYKKPLYNVAFESLEKITQMAFSQRRKMLKSSLREINGENILLDLNISPSMRPEEISVIDFCRIAEKAFNN